MIIIIIIATRKADPILAVTFILRSTQRKPVEIILIIMINYQCNNNSLM